MRKYEIMYILRADMDDAARKEAIESVNAILTNNGATISEVSEALGLRDLAYPIKEQTKGYYVVLKVTAEASALNEFDRLVKINPIVLRHMAIVDQQ